MRKIYYIMSLLAVALTGLSLTACSEDDLDTNQYGSGVKLNVYGPQPVMRGGQLRFLGSNLDQIAQVIIPGCDPITNIEVVTSGVPSEIRVTVPKDGPEEGPVRLITKTDDEIVTKTSLSYIEGIEFESFSPVSVMPGETLTIKGDYLNLVHMIEFSDGVYVSENDFVSHDRYQIEVAVPDEARTGKICLYDVDLTVLDESNADVSYNIIETDDVLNVGTPTITGFASPRGEAVATGVVTAKMGEQITVSGEYFNLIAGLKFGSEDNMFETSELTVSEDGKTLTFVLPEEAPDGDFNIVCRSGIEVPVGIIETVAPSNGVAAPAPVKAGMPLTITGNDMDVVYSVEMPNVDADVEIAFTKAADGKSVVITAVPETAQEGNLVLRMKNGKGVEVPFTLVKPVVTGYDNATVSAGGALTIQGTDLDLVKTVQFGESSDIVEVNSAEDGKSITLTIPMNAVSCEPVLTLANGTTVTGASLSIQAAVFCYATELPGEDAELKAGSTMTFVVANGDKLTGVEINGNACQYVLTDGNQLIIGIPDNAGAGTKVRLISSNGEITYTVNVTPNTEVNTVVWTGAVDLGSWSINWQFGDNTQSSGEDAQAFVNLGLVEGDVIHLYVTPYNDFWQIQFFDGHWGGQTSIGDIFGNGNNVNSEIVTLADGRLDIPVTAKIAEELTTLTDWGYCWIIQGEGVVVTKISVTHYNVLETAIWTGEWTCSGWGGNQDLAWGGYDWTAVKANATVRFYYTKIDASQWGCISLRHGTNWGSLPDPIPGQYDFPDGESGVIEVQFPQNVLDDIIAEGGLVITGDNYILNKVTVE